MGHLLCEVVAVEVCQGPLLLRGNRSDGIPTASGSFQ